MMHMNVTAGTPNIGQWYARADKGELFQVVGLDEHMHTIEVQDFDGDLDEIDDEAWGALPLERCAPPEDWTGPVDNIDTDDLGLTESDMTPEDWRQPLQLFSRAPEAWEDTSLEEERDALGEGFPHELFAAELAEPDRQLS
jgi:hypothetical protein